MFTKSAQKLVWFLFALTLSYPQGWVRAKPHKNPPIRHLLIMLLILSLMAIRFISTQQSSETNIQRINIHNLCSHYD
jgi:hypothetical protein